jgi:hypothetical protein
LPGDDPARKIVRKPEGCSRHFKCDIENPVGFSINQAAKGRPSVARAKWRPTTKTAATVADLPLATIHGDLNCACSANYWIDSVTAV